MNLKKRIWLLVLAGLFLGCAAFLFERQSNTGGQIRQAEGEVEFLEHNNRLAEITLSRMPDSLRDRSLAVLSDSLRQGNLAAAELSTLTLPTLRRQHGFEWAAMWVSGIFGVFFLIWYLRTIRLAQRDTEDFKPDVPV